MQNGRLPNNNIRYKFQAVGIDRGTGKREKGGGVAGAPPLQSDEGGGSKTDL